MKIKFPEFSGKRCLMMPYIQGDAESVPREFRDGYEDILSTVFHKKGDVGYLTIDESFVEKGKAHRGEGGEFDRALHTEAAMFYCSDEEYVYCWGFKNDPNLHLSGSPNVILEENVNVLIANNIDDSCAVWNEEVRYTTRNGDIGYLSHEFPLSKAEYMKAGEVKYISIFTPHESIPLKESANRQFLRIVSEGVHGREPYFTENDLITRGYYD